MSFCYICDKSASYQISDVPVCGEKCTSEVWQLAVDAKVTDHVTSGKPIEQLIGDRPFIDPYDVDGHLWRDFLEMRPAKFVSSIRDPLRFQPFDGMIDIEGREFQTYLLRLPKYYEDLA